jgi:enamine deaminase RidA (YjgF/YER057c/UK114 family)
MAGQVGRTLGETVPSDPIEQIEVALENVRRNLESAGMEVSDLIKLTWYLVGEIDSGKRRQITAAWLGGHQPCSTLLYVAALAAPEYKVEIDVWACRSDL